MSVDQHIFTDTLLNPDLDIPAGLVDPQGRPAGKRFNVYRNNVVYSLIEAMKTAFPAINKSLGDTQFRQLASIYVRKHPPKTPMMMFYGENFPQFLDDFVPLKQHPYLSDIATLELARRRCYHAADNTTDTAGILATISPEDLMSAQIKLSKAMHIIASKHPVLSLWNHCMTADAPKPSQNAEIVLITRPELDLEMRKIDVPTHVFLTSLTSQNLGNSYEAALTKNNDFDLGQALGLMLSQNMITDITI